MNPVASISTYLSYDLPMRRHLLRRLCRFRRKNTVTLLPGSIGSIVSNDESSSALKVVGWTSAAVGVAALGLYIGRELRARYKFRHRTPSDFFSHAGDETVSAEYGMGI
jgi:hypothetical protein